MSWINRLRNHMRQEAQRALADVSMPRAGIVTNYDPARYCARVELQPEGILTGYLPITSMWVGNGWGMYSPPSIGEVVDVHFHQGGKEAAYIVGRFYSAKTQPLPVQSGEFWLVHQTGSTLKLANDGSVTVSANTNMTLNAPNGTLRLAAENIQIHATAKFRFDTNGHGQSWLPDRINTYQIGEVPGTAHNISPPEIGD
jgi:phage baseplate assembly protein gpV